MRNIFLVRDGTMTLSKRLPILFLSRARASLAFPFVQAKDQIDPPRRQRLPGDVVAVIAQSLGDEVKGAVEVSFHAGQSSHGAPPSLVTRFGEAAGSLSCSNSRGLSRTTGLLNMR